MRLHNNLKKRFCDRFGGEEQHEENRVHLGNAIMSFYSALIDLLGRCAPEMHVSPSVFPTNEFLTDLVLLLYCKIKHLY